MHSNEHLTIARLSAYLDGEGTESELALCAAHIQTCLQCQAVLADLRVTCALLREMPRVDVPRSFVLPPALTVLPAPPGRGQPSRLPYLRRSLRVLSTLAAIAGLLFVLIGGSGLLPQNRPLSTTAGAPLFNTAAGSSASTPPVSDTRGATTPPGHVIDQAAARATARAQGQSTPTGTPASVAPGKALGPHVGLPAPLDLARPSGRLDIGAGLLVLGLLGVVLTRRPRRRQRLP